MVPLQGDLVRCRCERSMARRSGGGFRYLGPASAATYLQDPAQSVPNVLRLRDDPRLHRLPQEPLL
jgi:hypothetical protein